MAHYSIDRYYKGLSTTDLRVRGCADVQQCLYRYETYLRDLNQAEAVSLKFLLAQADQWLKPYKRLAGIPWKVRTFDEAVIESGLPHTQSDTIIMPSAFFDRPDAMRLEQITTLIHEKVHVYQRLFPLETTRLIVDVLGFSIYDFAPTPNSVRSNPDINQIIYKDEQGKIIAAQYTKDATTIHDILDKRDHPFEIMAYMLAATMTGTPPPPHASKYDLPAVHVWMLRYL